jgi:hypothetical protein
MSHGRLMIILLYMYARPITTGLVIRNDTNGSLEGGGIKIEFPDQEKTTRRLTQTLRLLGTWSEKKIQSPILKEPNPLLEKICKQTYRPPISDEARRSKEELTECNCYQFDPRCLRILLNPQPFPIGVATDCEEARGDRYSEVLPYDEWSTIV